MEASPVAYGAELASSLGLEVGDRDGNRVKTRGWQGCEATGLRSCECFMHGMSGDIEARHFLGKAEL